MGGLIIFITKRHKLNYIYIILLITVTHSKLVQNLAQKKTN